jgi:hypothetical protein
MERTTLDDRPAAFGLLSRVMTAGSLAGAAATAAIAYCGARETGSAVAPINATSHVLWGDEAGEHAAVDVKHTLPGFLINMGAGVFWALVHELLWSRLPRRDRTAALASGAAVAGAAYVVDYHMIPRRLSPGWELRVSPRAVALGFVALGAGLGLAALLRARR